MGKAWRANCAKPYRAMVDWVVVWGDVHVAHQSMLQTSNMQCVKQLTCEGYVKGLAFDPAGQYLAAAQARPGWLCSCFARRARVPCQPTGLAHVGAPEALGGACPYGGTALRCLCIQGCGQHWAIDCVLGFKCCGGSSWPRFCQAHRVTACCMSGKQPAASLWLGSCELCAR
jgi:hypothetical protein